MGRYFVINIKTSKKEELVDITGSVRKAVRDSKIDSGICIVYSPHTTGGIVVNENADPSVKRDILYALKSLGFEKLDFSHLEGNSPSHVKTSMVGESKIFIIDGGELVLGTWQGIFFAEFDGPRNRRVYVKVVPDA